MVTGRGASTDHFHFPLGGGDRLPEVHSMMKIVLAYSGGLDTSVLLSWIKEKYKAEMIAFCADIGQEEELKGLDKKAMATGASKVYIDDLQEIGRASCRERV